uniref:C-X-C chemokine receptor type 2 n=1 Tax=Mola mola TaxID=94237 RepID=A0A3Q3WDH4_MOLML
MLTSGPVYDGLIFNTYLQYNSTYYAYEDASSTPCSVTVPGFNSLGLMITYLIVFIFSMAGNSVVIYVFCFVTKARTRTDIYLMHLAIADLLFSLTLPFIAIDAHYGWVFGNFLCKVLSGLQEASVYSSVFLLACISVDRHLAIVRATRVVLTHHLLVKVNCVVVWVAAGLLSIPVAIQRASMHAEDLGQTICYENLIGESSNQWHIIMHILRHTLGFFLPLVVMTICYSWTLATLLRTRNQQKHKAIRVILAVVIAFVLCWLPYNVTVLINILMRSGALEVETCETWYRVEVARNVTQVLAFTHCVVNPVLYAFIGQKFRNQLLSTLYRHGLISKRLVDSMPHRCEAVIKNCGHTTKY